MTLIELVVGILMFTIISIAVSMMLAPILSSFTKANDFAEYNALLDNIANHLINDLSQSTSEPVFTEGDWAEDDHGIFLSIFTQNRIIRYAVMGGILQREGLDVNNETILRDVFSEDFYRRKLVSFMIETDETPEMTAYFITVRLTERGNAGFEIQRRYAVRPLIMNQID
jgi:hypothetical protein